jgi:hypothetical protein
VLQRNFFRTDEPSKNDEIAFWHNEGNVMAYFSVLSIIMTQPIVRNTTKDYVGYLETNYQVAELTERSC